MITLDCHLSSTDGALIQFLAQEFDKKNRYPLEIVNDWLRERSCYDCLRTYYNTYYQQALDRHLAASLITAYDSPLQFERDLPATDDSQTAAPGASATNQGEKSLAQILESEGFPQFEQQHEIKIGAPFNRTIPDFYFEDTVKELAVAIYLDGLSKEIHGNEEWRRIDSIVRQKLEILGISVVEISSSTLNDPQALNLKLAEIASKMKRKDLRDKYISFKKFDHLFE